jgi:hypothetical protein
VKLSKYLQKLGIPVGSAEDFPSGSVERAKLLSLRLHSEWSLASATAESWKNEVRRVKRESVHEMLGFASFDAYLRAVIGEDEKGAAQRFEADPGVKPGNPTGSNQHKKVELPTVGNSTQAQRAKENGVSRQTQIWLDRLARDRPDLLERVNVGELKPKTAARLAGIVRVPTPLALLKRAWEKAGKAERAAFMSWVKENGGHAA